MTECNELGSSQEEKCPSRITVYYPDAEDTLFGIAKKFHTTGAKIASDNSLTTPDESIIDTPESLIGVKKLIIR